MYITYHKEVSPKQGLSYFPHIILHSTIQSFIESKNVVQERYLAYSNDFCLFIYLDNGDRIDVRL